MSDGRFVFLEKVDFRALAQRARASLGAPHGLHTSLWGRFNLSHKRTGWGYDAILNNRYFKVDWSIPDVVKHHRRIWNLDVLLGRKFDGKYTMRDAL